MSTSIPNSVADAIRAAARAVSESASPFRQPVITGEMAIAALYLQEHICGVRVQCGTKLFAEIMRLESMTLAERIAERDGKAAAT